MRTLNSKAMKRANELRKEGLTKSEALKKAWAEVRAEYPSDIKIKANELQSLESMTTLEKIQEYKKLQNFIEVIQNNMEEIKKSIISEMETKQTDELKVDIFKVKYITVTSNRFNTTEFKKEHEALYNQYLKESKCKRFTIAC